MTKQEKRRARMAGREPQPTKTAGEVFITGGKKFHPEWCSAINGVWLSGCDAVRVIPITHVGHKTLCGICAGPDPYEAR